MATCAPSVSQERAASAACSMAASSAIRSSPRGALSRKSIFSSRPCSGRPMPILMRAKASLTVLDDGLQPVLSPGGRGLRRRMRASGRSRSSQMTSKSLRRLQLVEADEVRRRRRRCRSYRSAAWRAVPSHRRSRRWPITARLRLASKRHPWRAATTSTVSNPTLWRVRA